MTELRSIYSSADELPLVPVGPRPWQAVDLATVLDGSYSRPVPTVGRRSDGVCLFYAGRVHAIAAESEGGKTWMALSAACDEMSAGNHVLYLDFEDDEGGVVGRLLLIGLHRDVIRDRFHYLRPNEALGNGLNLDDLRDVVVDHRPTLAVVDGITEAMTMHGLDPLSNKDIATFGRVLPRRLAQAGAATVCLDHVTKDRENRGRYALGGVHKLNGLDGASFVLENRTPLGIGLVGRSTIRIAKDRPGELRKHGLPSAGGMTWFGDLVLDSSSGEDFAELGIAAPNVRPDGDFRPTVLMARICNVLDSRGPLSARKIEALVTGKATSIRQALTFLQVDGYVCDESPHRLLKPYEMAGDE